MGGRIDYDIPAAELEVLTAVWDLGPSPVRDVMNRLHDRGRKMAYTTVLTLLTRLEQRGLVACDKSSHAHVYRSRVSRDRVALARLRDLVRTLYDGAAAPLVAQLVQNERFTPGEVAELQRLIDELDTDR